MNQFERFAGVSSILAGLCGFLYAIGFIIISRSDPGLGGLLSALFLTLSGFFASPVLVALYYRLREVDASFALWAVILGLTGALGSMIHGGYDLANAINPPPDFTTELPSQVDPRGLLTFGLGGVALLTLGWLVRRAGSVFPSQLGYVGYLSGALSLILYLGRLTVLSASNPIILAPALLNGFIVNPLWYVWLGLVLRR